MVLDLKKVSLPAYAALQGFRRQVDLLRAITKAKLPEVPQPVLSRMYRGEPTYPQARASVATVLEVNERELLRMIANSAEEQ